MSSLTGPVGEVRADLVIDTDKTEESLRDGLKDVERSVDDDLEGIADVWGDTLAKALGDKLGGAAPGIADEFETQLSRQKITGVTFQVDKDGNVLRSWVRTKLVDPISDVIKNEAEKPNGGIFSKIGQGMADAIGAGFNISGRSPLIVALVFLIGFIVELVLGLIEVLGAAIALLTIVPGLLLAIGIQAGILMIAFEGVGTAIKGAFAAENAEELEKALEGLTPSAQQFVRELLPLKDIFKELKAGIQESFFASLNEVGFKNKGVENLVNLINSLDKGGLNALASELGKLLGGVLESLNNPKVVSTIDHLVDATVFFVNSLRAGLSQFIPGLFKFIQEAIPLMVWFGTQLTTGLYWFGRWLGGQGRGQLEYFGNRAKEIFGALWEVVKSTVYLIYALWMSIDRAGGVELLEEIAEQLGRLGWLLDTELGTRGMETLIQLAVLLSQALIGLIMYLIIMLGVWNYIYEFLTETLAPTWRRGKEQVEEFGTAISNAFTFAASMVSMAITAIVANLSYFINLVQSIPGIIVNAVSSIPSMMYNAGANIIQGLINGMLSKMGPLGSALGFIFGQIAAHAPHSPAKEGPLSGAGDPMIAGQTIVDRLATGMEMESSRINGASDNVMTNILFGPGAIQNSFYGAAPSPSQATGIGSGIGNGISGILAQRDTRLTVRAMA